MACVDQLKSALAALPEAQREELAAYLRRLASPRAGEGGSPALRALLWGLRALDIFQPSGRLSAWRLMHATENGGAHPGSFLSGLRRAPTAIAVIAFLFALMLSWSMFHLLTNRNVSSNSPPGDTEVFLCLALTTDGSKLIVGTGTTREGVAVRAPASLFLFDSKSLKKERSLVCPNRVDAVRTHADFIAAVSADEGAVRLWKLGEPNGPPFRVYKANGAVIGLEFSPDGRYLIFPSTRPDSSLCFWDYQEDKATRLPVGNGVSPMGIAVSSKAGLVATGTADAAEFFDLKKLERRSPMQWESRRNFSSMAFSPDGKLLAVAGQRKVIQVWEIATQKEVANFSGHTEAIESIAFAPSGGLLASGGWDKTVRLWSIQESKLIHQFSQDSPCRSLAFASDSSLLNSLAENGKLYSCDVKTRTETSRDLRDAID